MIIVALFAGNAHIAYGNGGGDGDDREECVAVACPTNACPFGAQSGRTIADFQNSRKIVANGSLGDAISGPVSVLLIPGLYEISLASFDGYADRAERNQPYESWFALLLNGTTTVATSSPIGDLADGVAFTARHETVNSSLAIQSSVTGISARHAAYPNAELANSVLPVCAAFDFLGSLTQCSDTRDNDEDRKTDSADPACHTDGNPQNSASYDGSRTTENSSPVIMLVGSSTVEISRGEAYADPGATAEDDEDGNITSRIVVTGLPVNTSSSGSSTITYNVADLLGALAEEVRRIVVVVATSTVGGGSSNGEEGIATSTPPSTPTSTVDGGSMNGEDDMASMPTSTPSSAVNGGSSNGDDSIATMPTSTATTTPPETPQNPPSPTASSGGGSLIFGVPAASGGSGGVSVLPLPLTSATGASGASVTECGKYLEKYIRFGAVNDPVEVRKLQMFLRNFEGFQSVQVTGFYDSVTFEAVKTFQLRYKTDVLDPWSLLEPTGYVYITTSKKINEIYCNKIFSLTAAQLLEIETQRALLERLRREGVPSGEIREVEGGLGGVPSNTDLGALSTSTATGTQLAGGAIPASVIAFATSSTDGLQGALAAVFEVIPRGWFFALLATLLLLLSWILLASRISGLLEKVRTKENTENEENKFVDTSESAIPELK